MTASAFQQRAWTQPATINKIWALNGTIRIDTTASEKGDTGSCTPGQFYFPSNPEANPHANEFLSFAMAAKATQQKVSVVMITDYECDGGSTYIFKMAVE